MLVVEDNKNNKTIVYAQLNNNGCHQITRREIVLVWVPENEKGNAFVVIGEEGKAWEAGKRSFLSKFDAATRRDISSRQEQKRGVLCYAYQTSTTLFFLLCIIIIIIQHWIDSDTVQQPT